MGFHPVPSNTEFKVVRSGPIRTDWKSMLRLLGQAPSRDVLHRVGTHSPSWQAGLRSDAKPCCFDASGKSRGACFQRARSAENRQLGNVPYESFEPLSEASFLAGNPTDSQFEKSFSHPRAASARFPLLKQRRHCDSRPITLDTVIEHRLLSAALQTRNP